MYSPHKKTCRFFTKPGGCRKGDRCPDEHSKSGKGRSDGPSSGGRFSGQKPPRAPQGKCDFYWATGSCKRAFECRFEHELSPDVQRAKNDTTSEGPDQLENSSMPYLSVSGLSDLSVSGGDAFRDATAGFTPQETQVFLRTFLRDSFRFSTPAQMYSFGKLLSSASSLNKSWTAEDGQLFLQAIAAENGCLRLSSVLSYENVSSTSHYDPKVLSFQRGYLPVFQYLSSKFVVKSTLSHNVNSVYTVLHNNLDQVLVHLDTCIATYMTARSFKEKPSSPESAGAMIFGPIVTVFFEYLSRFKTALPTYEGLGPFVAKLVHWVGEWADNITSANPTFDDVLTSIEQRHARELVSNHIKACAKRVADITKREQAGMDRSADQKAARDAASASHSDTVNLLRTIENYYEGPGEERRDGPRHDNDFVDIRNIKVAPTDQELICARAPFLPVNLPNAPHPFPKDSMQRLLDIQFRLLREELLAPLRTSVQVLLEDLQAPSSRKSQLGELKKKKGGRYNYQDRQESVMFNVYTNVNFSRIDMDSRRGMVVELQLDTPPGTARSNKANTRAAYWANGKRLMQGGLVALLWKRGDHVDVHLGTLCSAANKLAEAAKASDHRLPVRVQFFDAVVNFKVLEHLRSKDKPKDERLLVESSVMFETIRPFLESLKRTPEAIPFSTYLPHPLSGSLAGTLVHPPAYSRVPNFSFNLEDLHRPGEEDGLRGLRLVTTDPNSIEVTRAALAERSRLDSSQAKAIVDTLTREVAMIQGPPGTGKTFIGIELIRVLVKNNVGPILLIAFTNHALDHMLSHIIEKGITRDVVRLGGRSSDESIKSYSIEELERVSGRSLLDRNMKSEYRSIKETEEEITKLLGRVIGTNVPPFRLLNHIIMFSPDHVAHLDEPPLWICELHSSLDEGGWEEVGTKKKERAISDSSRYAFWKTGQDLKFIRDARLRKEISPNPSVAANRFNTFLHIASKSNEGKDDRLADMQEDVLLDSDDGESDHSLSDASHTPVLTDAEMFFLAHGESGIPEEPTSDRPLETLLESENHNIWEFSQSERLRIDSYWVSQYRESAYDSQKMRFEDLIEKHSDLRQRQHNRDEEIRLNIIRDRRLVGCTTTGAAKLISLLKGFSPRVMIVEEAGQVLESHVLASLVDSVKHLVMIGDPLQLRPTLNNFALSMDNPRGKDLYRFDMSLMERLSKSKLPMSRLDVQRRMRPEISSLIRDLYPGLQDHKEVLKRESVRGMHKDVFFLSHGHKEHGGGDDSVSKHNPYEVSMIKDLVKYLLRQGCYSSEGQIVVLCTYLGQLARVRDALREEVTVVIDERDQDALDQQEGEEAVDTLPNIERVQVTQRVKIRSVDNYQGEEADIVILSLVRNSGGGHGGNEYDIVTRRTVPSIGFLKSENRTNVALSRAKHGLYILGNASDLTSQKKDTMWPSVISQLDKNGAVGDAIPIKCHRHPEDIRYISKPGELSKVSPDGGCLLGCNVRLTCGHNCPYKCHADDENHRHVFCIQPCPKLCPKGHPCPKQCGDSCGNCKHPIRDVRLPCGHVHKSVPCHQMDDLSDIKCMVKVKRKLPTCEHSVQLPCSYDVNDHKCQVLCDGILPCCGKSCKAKCHSCQDPVVDVVELRVVPRTRHRAHSCGKPLYCAHACRGICSADHKCMTECKETCRQSCSHAKCLSSCSTPCAPCQEPCAWTCPHYTCPVPCGSICARLPCNLPCEKVLRCGHRCPSVCGEDCEIQICLTCAPKEKLSSIADLVMQRSLSELDPSQGSVDELIITLPGCKHAFTVETLDGHCQLSEYYEDDGNGIWRSLKSPASDFKSPPVCPTCRHAIRSPRYGRVYKRADLDIIEQNVTSQLSRSLNTVSDDFRSVDQVGLRRSIQDAGSVLHTMISEGGGSKAEIDENTRRRILNSDEELPVSWDVIDPRKHIHGIQTAIARRWSKEMQKVKKLYDRTLAIASARSAHVKAWEAAFSSLYRQEIENAVQEPSTAPRYPAEYAMRVAKMKVGMAKPLADKRFCVEAFWLTISIRHLLANVAQEWLTQRGTFPANASSFRITWSSFIAFILKTCERDAKVALQIAESTQSHKQALRSKVLVFNTQLETLKYNYQLYRDAVPAAMTRDELKEAVGKQLDELGSSVDMVNGQYGRSGSMRMELADFKRFFLDPMDTIRKELRELEEAIRTGIIYSSVTDEEKQQIIAGLMETYDLSYSGHFYRCPNGHPFVIGDCGGATEIARCPECYELIGGSGHNLLSTNSRDTEFEEIARRRGVQQNPWPWAR